MKRNIHKRKAHKRTKKLRGILGKQLGYMPGLGYVPVESSDNLVSFSSGGGYGGSMTTNIYSYHMHPTRPGVKPSGPSTQPGTTTTTQTEDDIQTYDPQPIDLPEELVNWLNEGHGLYVPISADPNTYGQNPNKPPEEEKPTWERPTTPQNEENDDEAGPPEETKPTEQTKPQEGTHPKPHKDTVYGGGTDQIVDLSDPNGDYSVYGIYTTPEASQSSGKKPK